MFEYYALRGLLAIKDNLNQSIYSITTQRIMLEINDELYMLVCVSTRICYSF